VLSENSILQNWCHLHWVRAGYSALDIRSYISSPKTEKQTSLSQPICRPTFLVEMSKSWS
jgi:hypothetical protein